MPCVVVLDVVSWNPSPVRSAGNSVAPTFQLIRIESDRTVCPDWIGEINRRGTVHRTRVTAVRTRDRAVRLS